MPVRTLNSGPNPGYFGAGRGTTYLNFLSDQFAGFHGIVVPGTLRDSLYILDGLLEQQTGLQPTELITDTAGHSDQVFGPFLLSGYQFSSRLPDIGGTRFWRINRDANYGRLNDLASHRINTTLMTTHGDVRRIAGRLATGTVKASELLRVSKVTAAPHSLDGPTPNTGASPRPPTYSPTWTTTVTDAGPSPNSTAPMSPDSHP